MGLFDAFKPKNEYQIAMERAKNAQKENSKDPLYQFEHSALPDTFYSTNYSVLELVLSQKDKNPIYELYVKACEVLGSQPKYGPESFKTSFLFRKDAVLMKVDLPEPYRIAMCSSVYLMTTLDGLATGYFCIELAQKIKEDDPSSFLCSWSRSHNHVNHTGIKGDPKNELGMERLEIILLGNRVDTSDVYSFDQLVEKVKGLIPNSTNSKYYVKPAY